MRFLTILILQAGLAAALPHSHNHKSRFLQSSEIERNTATCRNPVSPFDYSAKSREDYGLPICPAGAESSNLKFAEEQVAEFRFAGQVVGATDYTCAPDRPCTNGACCPKETLSCNYGEEFCGTTDISPNDVCWSNCDAKAECGENAEPPGKKCPLNVCCSNWGFCGMTEEFCKKGTDEEPGCQSNCDQPGPKDKASTQSDLIIGYYEAWRYNSLCQGMGINDIPVKSLTHLFFSFGYITPGDFNIAGMEDLPNELFSNFTAVKSKNAGLKTVIALGGWTFNDPGPTQKVFSNMVSTKENRAKFIDNLFSFMRQYAFDGVDFDWEYPGADDRGGIPEDGENFVTFLKELDEVNNEQPMKYSVSFTAPTSYWYLRHFDLKAVDYVDFINVMSYDLHGIWDGNNPIGSHIYGHTNITEIKLAFDLFWRNNVPAKKLNLGFGFYGRSFQLQDKECDKPGCVFIGGAKAGGCSGESGILSYREIQEIIKKDNLKPYHDEEAGVNYITYGGDQWVSFDNKKTFEQKKDLAKDLGLGGYLIWAVDQDDEDLSALQAVIAPKPLGELQASAEDSSFFEDANIPDCYITKCSGHCDAGYMKITEQKCGVGNKKSQLCCPIEGAPNPDDCTWRGTAPLCNGHCHDDEVMLEMNSWGSGAHCNDGHKAYCCKSPLAQENQCYWAGVGKDCRAGDKPMTFSGTVLSELADVAETILDVVGHPTPLGKLAGAALSEVLSEIKGDLMKLYCCPEDDSKKWEKCNWHGKPGSCFDNHCDAISEVQLTDSYYGGGETCGAGHRERTRVFCCEPVEGEELFLPVPLENLFKNPPKGDSVDTDFDLEIDDSEGGDSPSDAAFQFVVLTSPEELQISVDKRDGSHWDVSGCTDSVTEGEHTVQMVCTDHSENSNCDKIYLGPGVPGTILQMPKGCGPGKYAVAKSLEPAPHRLLPRHLSHLSSKSQVYDLTFDYDFLRVPRSWGNTQMRIDYSNQENYWDQVVAASASKNKRSLNKRTLEDVGGNHVRWLEEEFRDDHHFGGLEKRDLEERWFGEAIIDWLKKMISPEIHREFTNDIDETFTAKIVDESWSCENGDVGFDGHVSASALTNVKVGMSFGFTLIVNSLDLPLDLKKSYLTFFNEGEITATLTLDAVAKVFYSKEQTIMTLPFPGASFSIPGIATLGPNIHVTGSLDASMELAAALETKISIAKWSVRQTIPDAGTDEFKPKEIGKGDPDLDETGDFSGIQKPEFYSGVSVNGDITAKLSAAAEFGIRFRDQWKVGAATAAIVGEGSVMAKMGAGVSTTGECPFTYGMQVGAELYAKAEAPKVFKWPGAHYKITGWEKDIIEGGTCPDLGPLPTLRKRSTTPLAGLPWDVEKNITSDPVGYYNSPHERSEDSPDLHSLQKRAGIYGPAFSIPVGDYFCPSDEFGNSGGSVCKNLEGDWDDDKYLTDGEDYDERMANDVLATRDAFDILEMSDGILGLGDTDDWLQPRGPLVKRARKESDLCGLKFFSDHPSGGELPKAPAYGFEEPDVCSSYAFGAPLTNRVSGMQYDMEHVLEFQLPKRFMEWLETKLSVKGIKFTHPNPKKVDQNGNREEVKFCEYFRETWDIDSITVDGVGAKPVKHIGDQYPTTTNHPEELVVLEHKINTPGKGKAWGSESEIVSTKRWNSNLSIDEAHARSILKSIRTLIGSLEYHMDPTISGYLKKQKERVGTMFGKLDGLMTSNPRIVNGETYDAWESQNLEAEWNNFMNGRYILASTKLTKAGVQWLPELEKVWANQAKRNSAKADPSDNDDLKKKKETLRKLIEDIDALRMKKDKMGQWTNPF